MEVSRTISEPVKKKVIDLVGACLENRAHGGGRRCF
jgi:hypothetical protein